MANQQVCVNVEGEISSQVCVRASECDWEREGEWWTEIVERVNTETKKYFYNDYTTWMLQIGPYNNFQMHFGLVLLLLLETNNQNLSVNFYK